MISDSVVDQNEATLQLADEIRTRIWSCLPAIVESVDFTKQTVSAQPTIKAQRIDVSGNITSYPMPVCVDVPLCFPAGGGFSITLPISVGDEVLLVFASRCIDAWWFSGGVQEQTEFRVNDLSDGFAILAPRSVPNVISNISSNSLQIRDNSGATKVEITSAGIININANTVNINAANTNISGNMTVSGLVTASAGLAISGAATANGQQINTTSHYHTETGGNTGPAIQ